MYIQRKIVALIACMIKYQYVFGLWCSSMQWKRYRGKRLLFFSCDSANDLRHTLQIMKLLINGVNITKFYLFVASVLSACGHKCRRPIRLYRNQDLFSFFSRRRMKVNETNVYGFIDTMQVKFIYGWRIFRRESKVCNYKNVKVRYK